MNTREFMTVGEVAKYLRVTEKTVYRLVKRGKIPAAKIGQQWRLDKGLIDDWVHRNSVGISANILVIDDEEVIRSYFKEILHEMGHRVSAVGTGSAGIKLIKQLIFDLVFLDLLMPEMDGAEILQQIKMMDPGLPVVIITGYPDSSAMDRALTHGPFAVIKKPIKEGNVVDAIATFSRVRKDRAPRLTKGVITSHNNAR